jgi:hypothetical protein
MPPPQEDCSVRRCRVLAEALTAPQILAADLGSGVSIVVD